MLLDENNEPWFVAKDVCDALEIKNPSQALNRLDVDERAMFNIGRQGNTNIVNEYGLYTLILWSKKPEAKVFKRWVTHDVLKSIRKTGAYMTPLLEKTILRISHGNQTRQPLSHFLKSFHSLFEMWRQNGILRYF
ncbi:BRO-N domain-containing protein [Belliella buryatensis]|uniref:BRO-N domain-containing protein n=1 Tax=Belliella buryatensis TaxID=1500549 RepID=UPI001BAEFCFC|nr:Bro-N domain-containing protein [Belliella buryatensis]